MGMRWDDLFADLQAQAGALAAEELHDEVAERTRIETSQLGLYDRLGPAVGGAIRLNCAGGLVVAGNLSQLNPEWLLIDGGSGRESLVVYAAVLSVSGVGRLSTPNQLSAGLAGRLGLRYALRGISRDRSAVRLHLVDASTVAGTIDRVGADFLELAVHPGSEYRRRDEVIAMSLIALSALVAVSRDG